MPVGPTNASGKKVQGAEGLLGRNGLDQWCPVGPPPHRLKLVDLIGEIADEDRGCRGLACSRFDTGVRHAIQQIETLAPSANEPA